MDSGREMSLTSTRSTRMPHGPSVGASITSLSSALTCSRSDSNWSMLLRPVTDRSEVWATWDTAKW